MPRLSHTVLLSALVTSARGQSEVFTISSGWEFWDGMDPLFFSPVLGSYGAIASTEFETSGCYSGDRCLKFTETVPLDGTPQVYLAYITNLQEGDEVYASFWGKGSGTTTKTRLWAHYTENDHTDYDGSASGPSTYVGLEGVWEKTENTWIVPAEKTGMIIEARIYAYDGGYGDSPDVWVDDLTVTVTSATGLVGTAPAYESFFTDPGDILGTYTYDYNTGSDAENVVVEQISEGCYSYPSCYQATEDPLIGTPQVWVAAIYNLSPYDHVFGQMWVKGAGGSTKGRIWASYFEGEVTNYAASHADAGPDVYKGEDGLWGVSSYSWPIEQGRTGLLIQARVYAYEEEFNSMLIDNLLISTNSTTAYVIMAPLTGAPPAPPLEGAEHICRCFANGAENEPFCEIENDFNTLDTCEATSACHWGPLEVPACNDYWPRGGPVHTELSYKLAPRICRCWANGAENELYCEGDIHDEESCKADERCHWGPSEFEMCNENWPQDTPQEELICRCLANGAENEAYCESGEHTSFESCTSTDQCHWGPHEVPACNPNWPHDSPFPVINTVARVSNFASDRGDSPVSGEAVCRCFANGPENEGFCETFNDFTTLESCEATDACHWGPLEVPACNDYWPRGGPIHTELSYKLAPRICSCWANGAENEQYCEGLLGPDAEEECIADERCHWGPSEFEMCNENWPQDTPQEEHICRCLANGAENEAVCESGELTSFESCTNSGLCHWGPHEVPACNPNWPHDSPFPVINTVARVANFWSDVGR